MEDNKKEQQEVCLKFQMNFVDSPKNFKIGISKNIKESIFPINGLRHPIQGDTCGWYIWRGEEYSEDEDFFMPLHIEHLKDWCPEVIKYLGLPPGSRVLLADNYEDVWEDTSLLNIS